MKREMDATKNSNKRPGPAVSLPGRPLDEQGWYKLHQPDDGRCEDQRSNERRDQSRCELAPTFNARHVRHGAPKSNADEPS